MIQIMILNRPTSKMAPPSEVNYTFNIMPIPEVYSEWNDKTDHNILLHYEYVAS